MQSLKDDGQTHKTNHPNNMTAEEYNQNRRKYEYPKKEEISNNDGFSFRVHSPEADQPRARFLLQWTRCKRPKGGSVCKRSGHSLYYVRLADGTIRAAFKVFGDTCQYADDEDAEEEAEAKDGDEVEEDAGGKSGS